jgi:hypothetical protein
MNKLAGRTAVVGAMSVALIAGHTTPAWAQWIKLSDKYIDVLKVCKDGVKFKASQEYLAGQVQKKVNLHAAAAVTPYPTEPGNAESSILGRRKITLEKVNGKQYIEVGSPPEKIRISHRGAYTLQFKRKLQPGTKIAASLENFKDGAVAEGTVQSCKFF